jgi:hypothetical protein
VVCARVTGQATRSVPRGSFCTTATASSAATAFAHGGAMPVTQLAGLGQRQLAGGAVQQPHAQPGLEFGDAARQARLGQVQGPGRSREAAVVHHFGKEQQFVEVLHRTIIRSMSRTI